MIQYTREIEALINLYKIQIIINLGQNRQSISNQPLLLIIHQIKK